MRESTGLPSGKYTLVEAGTELKGTVSSTCPIVVMGTVEGDVTGPMIQVNETGVLAGTIKVEELRSAGEIAGEVHANIVTISGKVRDRTVIRAKTLNVSLDSRKGMEVMFGECELAIGDEPDKEAAIAAAASDVAAEPQPARDDGKRAKTGEEVEARGRRRRSDTETPPPA